MRLLKINIALLFVVGSYLLLNCSGKSSDDMPEPPEPSVVEPVFVQNGQITNTIIHGFEMDIYTPENYSEEKAYPVIYFNDGQSLFKGNWKLQEQLNSLIQSGLIEEVIVVGIYSDGSRVMNYTPYEDAWMSENWGMLEPLGEGYVRTIVEKVIPKIDEHFSTIKDKSGRAFMGYSLGGLIATWGAIHYHEHFSIAAGLSPSFWAGNYGIFNENPAQNEGLKIWFDIGTDEWNYYVPFQRLLIEQGFSYGEEAFYFEVLGGTHDIQSWKGRIRNPLIAFFGLNKDLTPVSMNVHTEVIPSISTPGRFFLRINPVVRTRNGIQYSLAGAATYSVQNPELAPSHPMADLVSQKRRILLSELNTET